MIQNLKPGQKHKIHHPQIQIYHICPYWEKYKQLALYSWKIKLEIRKSLNKYESHKSYHLLWLFLKIEMFMLRISDFGGQMSFSWIVIEWLQILQCRNGPSQYNKLFKNTKHTESELARHHFHLGICFLVEFWQISKSESKYISIWWWDEFAKGIYISYHHLQRYFCHWLNGKVWLIETESSLCVWQLLLTIKTWIDP